MTQTLILHIGHYKTGTTALQVFMSRNRDALARQGLVYADAPLHQGKHSALPFSLLREAGVTDLLHDFDHPDSAATLWQALFAATRALPDGQAMLVSSEEFIRLGAHPAAVDLLRAQIETARDLRVRVIAYLRPPQAHLASWYNQLVKMGIDVPGYDATILARTEAVHWDYGLALRPWIDLFGGGAITLRPFHSGLRQGDALIEDFLDALGQPVPVLAESVAGDPNPRLDDRVLALRRGAGRAGGQPAMARQMAEDAAAALAAEGGAEAPRRDFAALRAEAEAGLDTLAALPGAGDLAERLRADLPRPQDPAERRLDEVVAMLAAELARLRLRVARQASRIRALESGGQGPDTDGPA